MTQHPAEKPESVKGPAFLRFSAPIVDELREIGHEVPAKLVTERVLDRLEIPHEERQAATANGQSRLRNQVAWARYYLSEAGLVEEAGHGMWTLTAAGRAATLDAPTILSMFKAVQRQLQEQKAGKVLSPDRLADEYARFSDADTHDGWGAEFAAACQTLSATSDDELRTRAAQEKLWSLDEVGSVGLGITVKVGEVASDPEFVEAILALRRLELRDEPAARAKVLQAAYEGLLGLVHPRHATKRPLAKLARIFTAFFPRDTHTAYGSMTAARVAHAVLGKNGYGLVEGMVLVRAKLREVLGDEDSLDEDARRVRFCWDLVEAEASPEPTPETGPSPSISPSSAPLPEPPALEPLLLWPYARQKRGLVSTKGHVEAWRAVVNACWHGAPSDDLVVSLRESFGLRQLSEQSCRQHMGMVRGYRFVAVDAAGIWRPTDDGRRLVDDDLPDVLVERFLVESYGLAQVLRDLRDGPLARADQMRLIRSRYPGWTNDFGPSSLTAWAAALGLTHELADKRRALTTYGHAWEARLPGMLPEPPEPDPVVKPVSLVPPPATPPLTFDAIYSDMRKALKGFVLDESQVRSLHVALNCHPHKHFVLLAGLSGTGKTELLRQYGRSVMRCLELDPDAHVLVAAVAPDWRDPTGLIGYLNPLRGTATWQRQPALELLLQAHENPTQPFFLILDEMNLAQVEHYFAPFLSAMESLDGTSRLHLHDEDGDVDGVPASIPWPSNLFIGGTLNMDESVHPVSDKVLDRAFTLEFWDVDLAAFLATTNATDQTKAVLLGLHAELAKVRRHFGYRTAAEIVAFVGHADARPEMLDQAIFSKVLPKLRGADSPPLREALAVAAKLTADNQLTRCSLKLHEMRVRLTETGMTRFWS